MSVRTLPYPADLAARLRYQLRSAVGRDPVVRVTPRTEDGRKSSAWGADFYELNVFSIWSDALTLDSFEEAVRTIPGVYRATRVAGGTVQDRDWPVASTRRSKTLRNQVLALMHDPEAAR